MSGVFVASSVGGRCSRYSYLSRLAPRTLSVANCGVGDDRDAVERQLRETFTSYADIEAVEVSSSGGGQRRQAATLAARITFAADDAVGCILEAPPKCLGSMVEATDDDDDTMDVFAQHAAECLPTDQLEKLVEASLISFEADEQTEAKRRASASEAGADAGADDGFTVVTYKRKAVDEAPRPSDGARKRARGAPRPSAGPEQFYRFQQKNAKRDKLAELRQGFEADKAKIAKLKTSRNCKSMA
ncbi:ribosomal RNA-processing protein 7-domain-containing protein [Pelagophyceae sp. CCMP2097]|nr:ribosomal RNA-processing protein 7-domain-containing protein [Pelagophyceae sp. CCMP2097]|mmetsp:Transcript_14859/g.49796  ORF Transcript_14859/g.49796 Transcript_14859/m.49796 type:complete len:244 (+) Transcript_14859:35-766(+)|eukprot:CAMPEP_0184245004 /NCGR_PEP_ID=MMETSP0977-20130417/1216_1 /TAXON_ID=483370 /ORGANISM="non described non described, Strain CCMP2097" /LENGTH=243 /DNA_ID=CAMNT_0026550301 /DNA_START=38 /DNA_END=769 /DNA_ORIENTATION=-